MINKVVYSAPSFAALSSTETKLHLKVDDTTDDTLITALIAAATGATENYTWLTLCSTVFDVYLDGFPAGNIELNIGPVSAVSSIKYYNSDNTLTTITSTDYLMDMNGNPLRIQPVDSWPSTYDRTGSVVIRLTAGYASAAAIPQAIKQALLLMVGHWYENREDVIVGRQVNELPMASKWLLDPFRVYAH